MRHRLAIGLAAVLCAAWAGETRAQAPAASPVPAASPTPARRAASAPARQALPPLTVYTKDSAPPTPKLEDLPLRNSVSNGGITWTFERPARVGQFVNGDWYVVGEVTVRMIDPKPLYGNEVKGVDPNSREGKKYKGQYCRNGSVLNVPVVAFQSGFDSRVPHDRYKPGLSAHLPIAMKPGDALVSSISKAKARVGDYCMASYSVLTCLKDPVPADALRPGYCDRQQVIYLARNFRRDLLPRLPLPPAPAPAEVADLRVKTYPPDIQDSEEAFQQPWLELNFFEGDQASYQSGGYGRAVAEKVGRAVLLLTLDRPRQEKERLLVDLTQYGLDLFALLKNGYGGWPAHGGWGSGRKLPIVLAGHMLGDANVANINKTCPKALFQEDTQTMYDDGWSGAGVVYFGHIGTRIYTDDKVPAGWGPYEHLHPSRWVEWIGTSYRSNMTGNTWVGEAIAIRILQLEKEWGSPAFLDYCDRWMTEPDSGYMNDSASFSLQGNTWDPFYKQMWRAYRNNLPAIDGKKVERPATGWKKERAIKGPPVEVGANSELRVADKPFLPLMMFATTPDRIDDAVAIGVNTLAEGSFEPHAPPNKCVKNNEFLDKLEAKGLLGVFGADARTVGHPALLGWIHLDAPDVVLRWTPAQRVALRDKFVVPSYRCALWAQRNDPLQKDRDEALVLVEPAYRWMKAMDKGRPVFLTLGSDLLRGEGNVAPAVKDKLYPEYVKSADAVGCAIYPVTEWNSPAKMDRVAEGVSQLVKLAGSRPVYAWIETMASPPPPAPKGKAATQAAPAPEAAAMKPAYARAEAWMAIIRGATGIGYRGFESPQAKVKPDDAMLAELKKLNARLAALAPAILAAPARAKVEMSIAGGLPCHLKATQLDGSTYVFAQNIDLGADREKLGPGQDITPRAGRASIKVAGLKAGTKIEVVDESRSLTADEGAFADDFAPLAEHVYKFSQ